MFKTDQKSLEELSFAISQERISEIRNFLDLINRNNMLTLPKEEFRRIYGALSKIEALKLEGKIYAFYVEDTYADKQGGDSGEGVELYLRQGNKLKSFAVNSDRDWVLKVDQVVPLLKEKGIDTIYTGRIEYEFLGLPKESDPDDPIYRKKLGEFEINEFLEEGIKVITLESLV